MALTDEQESFKDKIRSIQFGQRPHVVVKDRNGSTQTYHHGSKKVPGGRVDADVHPETVIVDPGSLFTPAVKESE